MPTLLVENGPDRGKGLELKPGTTYTLGRDPHCDFVLNGELVSRHHCRLKEFKGSYYLKDLDSLNGVFLNDQRVGQSELKAGDKVQLGDVVLTFLGESLEKSKEEKVLGGYRLLERVGRGGMGTVYRAIQISLDREVALKLLSPELVKDKTFVEQFFREARAAGQLNHPHIVQVYDVGQEGETFYYSMEYVRGGSLEDRLRKEGKLPVAEVLRVAHEAALALEYAESRHIVHRDIKPDNLMLAEDGRVRVADLGLALSLKSGAEHSGQPILGTPHFISPEQALRRDIDIRSDIYSLGATMYRMLSGRTLFTGASAEEIVKKAVREEPTPLREVAADVPEKVAALVHRMVRKDPGERFASAKELRAELDRMTRHPKRTKVLIALAVVAVVSIGAAVTLALKKPKERIVTVESPDAEEQRKHAFAMKSDLDKRKIELEAVRAYVSLLEKPRPRDEMKEELAGWVRNYDYLPIAEHDAVHRRLQEIDDQQKAEVEARERAVAARATRIDQARTTVHEVLDKGQFLEAFSRTVGLAPEQEADDETRQQLTALQTSLLEEVRTKAHDESTRRANDVEAAVQASDLAHAIALGKEGEAAFPLPPSDLAEPAATEVRTLHELFAKRRAELEGQLHASESALAKRDATRVESALGATIRKHVLELDFAAAAGAVDDLMRGIETPEAREELEPLARALHTGATLLERTLAALDKGSLPAEPPVHLPGEERPSEFTAFDRDKRAFKLKVQGQHGTSFRTVACAELANSDGLRQLFWPRLELSTDERLGLAETMTVVEVMRWAESLSPLESRIDRYDPEKGWTDDLREGMSAPPLRALDNDVAAVLRDLPADERSAKLRAAAEEEQQTAVQLLAALDPFLKGDHLIGWATSAAELKRILSAHRKTLLLRMVRPWIEGA